MRRGAQDLDRLITYLRVALPRLREAGSTIEAEIELVKAYLAVVTSLHGGRPALYVTLPDDCRDARFYPMLLLPLVQRAVRQPSGEPAGVDQHRDKPRSTISGDDAAFRRSLTIARTTLSSRACVSAWRACIGARGVARL